MAKLPNSSLALGAVIALLGFAAASPAQEAVAIWKSPDCGCCEAYAGYLRENGFAVTVHPTEDVAGMSRMAGIPDDLQGCHLGFVDAYVVSGHVPVETIRRLLTERPAVAGLTLPGMPAGTPGMTGSQSEPWTIYSIGNGAPEVYAVQ